MPNRIIKESICTSDNLNELTPEQEVFFYRLMVSCDDFGRMDARPQILLAKCFPLKLDSVSVKDIDNWLQVLVHRELVTLYEADGKPYLYMTTWDRHQQKRAKNSKYPAPPANDINNTGMISDDIKCNHVQSNVPEKRETRNENTRNDDEKRETDIEFEPEQIESDGRRRDVLKKFEEAWGRMLTAAEVAMIEHRVDKHGPDLVLLALEISVLNQVLKIKYLDAILDSWDKANLKTVQQVQEHEKQRKGKKERASPGNKCDTTGEQYEIFVSPARLEALKTNST